MNGHVGVWGTNDGDIVDAFTYVGKKFTDFDFVLPITLKFERRTHCRPGHPLGFQGVRQQFAVPFTQHGLMIEGIYLRRTSISENVDDPLGLSGKMRRARMQIGNRFP